MPALVRDVDAHRLQHGTRISHLHVAFGHDDFAVDGHAFDSVFDVVAAGADYGFVVVGDAFFSGGTVFVATAGRVTRIASVPRDRIHERVEVGLRLGLRVGNDRLEIAAANRIRLALEETFGQSPVLAAVDQVAHGGGLSCWRKWGSNPIRLRRGRDTIGEAFGVAIRLGLDVGLGHFAAARIP